MNHSRRKPSTVALAVILGICILGVLTGAFAQESSGSKIKPQSVTSSVSSSYPDAVFAQLPGGERFKDPIYFNLMLGNGLQSVPSKVIFERMTAATSGKENYKALYLARIFTNLEPTLAAGWANRAALATALGLKNEATACEAKAHDVSDPVHVPSDLLPGYGVAIKPASLSDWAAAMSLLADDIATKFTSSGIVAVRDDLSGIQVPNAEEVKSNDEELVELGLPPDGPWSAPAPIKIQQIMPNSFVLVKAEAMHYKTVKKGSMFGAMVMAGLSGMTAASNPVASAADSEVAGKMASEATNVANHYVGGGYTKLAFPEGSAKPIATDDHPMPTGKSHAVGNPIPVLWASGGSNAPTYFGHWSAGTKPLVVEHKAGKKEDPKHRAKAENIPDLQYPRLSILCASSCSKPMSALELMLTREDLLSMQPDTVSKAPQDLEYYRQAYNQNSLTLEPTNLRERWYLGYDNAGNVYEVNTTPAGWLVPPSTKP